MAYKCEQGFCIEKVIWKCDGCSKILCKKHSEVQYHDCANCYYCGKKANGYCDLCNKNSCTTNGCINHRMSCNTKTNTNYDNNICKLCINGRIPINSFGDSRPCHQCYGNTR